MKLWPRAHVRKIRFHDLRHTTATLLMMAGANPAAVQRILRHSDPRITTEVYGHLAPEYLRKEIDLLSFAKLSSGIQAAQAGFTKNEPFGALVVQEPNTAQIGGLGESRKPLEIQGSLVERETGLGPATLGLGSRCSTN